MQNLCSQPGSGRAARAEINPIAWVQPEQKKLQKVMTSRKERAVVPAHLKFLAGVFSSPHGTEAGGKEEEKKEFKSLPIRRESDLHSDRAKRTI